MAYLYQNVQKYILQNHGPFIMLVGEQAFFVTLFFCWGRIQSVIDLNSYRKSLAVCIKEKSTEFLEKRYPCQYDAVRIFTLSALLSNRRTFHRTVSLEMQKQKQQGLKKKQTEHCKELKPDRIILISALYVKQIFIQQANGLW